MDNEDKYYRASMDFIKYVSDLEETVRLQEEQIKNLKRLVLIKNGYMDLVLDLFYDYDGYYNRETKSGNVHDLADLIDEAVGFLESGLESDDKRKIFQRLEEGDEKFKNILKEDLGE